MPWQFAYADETGSWGAGYHKKVALPGYRKRPFDVFVPDGLDSPAPVLLVLHGGGSDASNANRVTCPDGNVEHSDCIIGHAARNAYIAVFPRGTSRVFLRRVRTWNAGGGDPDKRWICTSGLACEKGVDDIIAAIVAVAGTNQVSAVQGCKPGRAVPVLQIHGTADCAWPYDGGTPFCAGVRGFEGAYLAVEQSMRVWQAINGCSAEFEVTELADRFDDRTQVARLDWLRCKAPLAAFRIDDGGHTWPNGFQYFAASRIGPVTRELTNDDIWAFLASRSLR